MKKLFTLAFSALMVLGVASCGTSYSEDVLEDKDHTFHAVGGFEGTWGANDNNKMAATSVKAVSEFSKDLADTLAKKSLKYLYTANITIKADSAGWTTNAMKDGKKVEVDGKFTLKAIIASFNQEEKTYVNDHWIPNPADTDPGHMEALTDNIFVPAYQKEPDANGFSWADNPVMLVEEGTYHFVVAQYTAVSSESVVGYGFGLVKLVLK